jgi:TRAP-type C4-dicarboxylate transport system substrate-binding protein
MSPYERPIYPKKGLRKEIEMKTKKRFWPFLLVILFPLLVPWSDLVAVEVTYTGPPITIRYSSHVPATHMVFKAAFIPWMQLLEKESKGKLTMKTYMSGALHGPRDGFKACVADITDMSHGYPIWQPASFNLAHGMELPFAFPNAMVSCLAGEELYPRYLKKEYEKMEVYLAKYQTTSAYHILTKKPVRKLEDLKGMKLRSPGGSLAEMLKRFGATPIFITTAEVYNAFQRGTVDGAILYDNGFVSFRLHEMGKYRTELAMGIAGIPYCLNRKTFDNLPKDLKRVFYNMLRRLVIMEAIAYEEEDLEARNIMKKIGIQTITLPPQEMERWKSAIDPLWEDFIAKNEALGLPARQLVKDLRALSTKYAPWTPDQFIKHVTDDPLPGIIDGM